VKLNFWYIQKDNMVYPSFYYGYCWFDFMQSSFVYAVFPFNYFIRIWHVFRKFQDGNRHFHGCRDRSEVRLRERELATALNNVIQKYDNFVEEEYSSEGIFKSLLDEINHERMILRKYKW
jgi:hypothetical protein